MDKSREWINQDIVIDFEFPRILRNSVEEAEELAKKGNSEYFCVADDIDVICKGLYRTGVFTSEQWDIVCAKYHV